MPSGETRQWDLWSAHVCSSLRSQIIFQLPKLLGLSSSASGLLLTSEVWPLDELPPFYISRICEKYLRGGSSGITHLLRWHWLWCRLALPAKYVHWQQATFGSTLVKNSNKIVDHVLLFHECVQALSVFFGSPIIEFVANINVFKARNVQAIGELVLESRECALDRMLW